MKVARTSIEAEDAVRLDLVEHATGFRSGVCGLFHVDDQLLVEGDARVRERSAIPGEPLPLAIMVIEEP